MENNMIRLFPTLISAVSFMAPAAQVSPQTQPTVEEVISELGPIPRPEHPRPDCQREDWQNLNGVWEFAFDPKDVGLKEKWQSKGPLAERIVVPFCPESRLSGIGDESFHSLCWYARNFDLSQAFKDYRLLLHFGAVDYRTDVWLNGRHLGRHFGGYDPFSFDVTDVVRSTGNRLVLRVHDDPSEHKPSGKQSPELHTKNCQYMRVTGIWQTVWIEAVGATYIRDWTLTTDTDTETRTGTVRLVAQLDGPANNLRMSAIVTRQDGPRITEQCQARNGTIELTIRVAGPALWTPEHPALYDLCLRLEESGGRVVDEVLTYFGFRRIETRDGQYLLNGRPFFWISALDQGYYPDGLYTPPSDAAQRMDVEWAKRYGLNGIRKHQIVPEPRFLYWCDKLGLTTWAEMADWNIDETFSTPDVTEEFLRQWTACMRRDINHPCIITWVPTNEKRAPRDPKMIAFKTRVYDETRKVDPTRPVIDTSGYCHTKTDITDLHVNPVDGRDCRRWWKDWTGAIEKDGNFMAYPSRDLAAYCPGYKHQGQPVIISETGNWRITELPPMRPEWEPYGYGPVPTLQAYKDLYRDFFLALIAEPRCAGFSYVQLYDTEGEVNGYLTYDRKCKVEPEFIAGVHAEGLRLRSGYLAGNTASRAANGD